MVGVVVALTDQHDRGLAQRLKQGVAVNDLPSTTRPNRADQGVIDVQARPP